jgi:hypothetical protein
LWLRYDRIDRFVFRSKLRVCFSAIIYGSQGGREARRITVIGASSSLLGVPAKVRSLNAERSLSFACSNAEDCPLTDGLTGRTAIKRM